MARIATMLPLCGLVVLIAVGCGPRGTAEADKCAALSDPNNEPLLLPLARRLETAARTSRYGPEWRGQGGGVRMTLQISADLDVEGEIVVGVFSDPIWNAPPVQLRAFPAVGRYQVEGLPPGQYVLGAIAASKADATGEVVVGVHRQWPQPARADPRGTSCSVRLLARMMRGPKPLQPASGAGEFSQNSVQGTVAGPDGQPSPYAIVQWRSFPWNGRMFDLPTDEKGRYRCTGLRSGYRIGVIVQEPLPALLGHRYQYSGPSDPCGPGQHTLDRRFPAFPVGTAAIVVKVVDQRGQPVTRYFLNVANKVKWEDDGIAAVHHFGYRLAAISSDGSYRLTGLPAGTYEVRAFPFAPEYRTIECSPQTEVTLREGQSQAISLAMERKVAFYARVLFEDGTPAVCPPPWPGAHTKVELQGSGPGYSYSAGAEPATDGRFSIYLTAQQITWMEQNRPNIQVFMPRPDGKRARVLNSQLSATLSTHPASPIIIRVPVPQWMWRPVMLSGRPLPKLEPLGLKPAAELAGGKRLLVCFFDMEQRPSRRAIQALNEKAAELAKKGVAVVAVEAAGVDEKQLRDWAATNKIALPLGLVAAEKDTVAKTLANWGAAGLPWLILTDEKHIVSAEGLSVDQLDAALSGPQTRPAEP